MGAGRGVAVGAGSVGARVAVGSGVGLGLGEGATGGAVDVGPGVLEGSESHPANANSASAIPISAIPMGVKREVGFALIQFITDRPC